MNDRWMKVLALVVVASLAIACERVPQPTSLNAMATIASSSGDVTVSRAGTSTWAPASDGMRLAAGDRVWCRAGGADIRYDIGETARLTSGTIVTLR